MREKIVGKCVWLEGRGKEKMVGIDYFLFGSTKLQSLQNREKTRHKTFVHVKRIFGLWYFATRSSFFFFFCSFSAPPTSYIHFGLFFLFFYSLFFSQLLLSFLCFYLLLFFLRILSFPFPFFLFTHFCFLSLLLSLVCLFVCFFFFFFLNRDASFSN